MPDYIHQLKTSGEVEITHPSGKKSVVPLEQLTLLMDGMSREGMDMWDEEDEDMEHEEEPLDAPGGLLSMAGVSLNALGQFFYGNRRANQQDEDRGSNDSWETYESADVGRFKMDVDGEVDGHTLPDDMEVFHEPTIAAPVPIYPRPSTTSPKAPDTSPSASGSSLRSFGARDTTTPSPPSSLKPTPIPTPPSTNASTPSPQNLRPSPLDDDDEGPWQRFAILPSTPNDHAFLTSKPGTPQASKAFMTRLAKEYKVLATSLPGLYSSQRFA